MYSPDRPSDGEEEMMETSTSTLLPNGIRHHSCRHNHRHPRFPGAVRKTAYSFDGLGGYSEKDWDLLLDSSPSPSDEEAFSWYHVELPKRDQKLTLYAQYLIDVLCPPLKLQEILAIASNGPFCGHVDGALVFRVNSPGPPGSNFTLRLAARVTARSVVTVSLGRVPRLGFSRARDTLLSEIPAVDPPGGSREDVEKGRGRTLIEEHVLEFFLTMNHSEQADNPVPRTVADLVVHIVDTHVDHVQDIVTNLEIELDSVELELDRGGYALKKQMLDDRRFAKLHLDIQRLLQAVAHSEQVFPRVKEKCASKSWFTTEDIASLEELITRLRRIKENLGFIVNRVTAIQTGLDSWQSEQINRKLYYLSFLSMIFLPLSIITGMFGMNVGGVPWTGQNDPSIENGFRNVIFICITMFILPLFFSGFRALYIRISGWRRGSLLRRSLSLNRKGFFLRRTASRGGPFPGAHYVRL